MLKLLSILLIFSVGCANISQPHSKNLTRNLKSKYKKNSNEKSYSTSMTSKLDSDLLRIKSKKDKLVDANNKFTKTNRQSEQLLYSQLLDSYLSNKDLVFLQRSQQFAQQFPNSYFMQDLLYMRGLVYLANSEYGKSLVELNSLLSKYPQGRKVVSAIYAKSVVLRKMNLAQKSNELIVQVLTRFPGSPEFYRAQVDQDLYKKL